MTLWDEITIFTITPTTINHIIIGKSYQLKFSKTSKWKVNYQKAANWMKFEKAKESAPITLLNCYFFLQQTHTHTATTCTTMVNLIYCFIMIRLAFNSSKAVSLLSIRPVYACMLYILCCFSRLFIYLYSFNRVHLNSINYLQILRPFVCVFLMYVHWKQTLQWQF